MNKKANAVDAVAVVATNADERAILRARISRRFAVEFLLYGFSELRVFIRLFDPRHATVAGIFFSSYMHAECSLRKITIEFRHCHGKARNMKLLTREAIRSSDTFSDS